MATKQPESVVGKLMGLDEKPPDLQPFRRHRRVLSDSYIRKVASVGVRQGSSVLRTRSCNADGKMSHKKPDVALEKCSNSNALSASASELLSGATNKDRKSSFKGGQHYACKCILRDLQKFECDPLAGHLQLEMRDKPRRLSTDSSVLEPNSVKAAFNFGDLKLELYSKSECRDHGERLMPESKNLHDELAYRNLRVNSCITCNQTPNRISEQEKGRSTYKDISSPRYTDKFYFVKKPHSLVHPCPGVHGFQYYNHAREVLPKKSYWASVSENKQCERWKRSKEDPADFGRGQTLNEKIALADRKLMPGNLRLGRSYWNLNQDKSNWRDKLKKRIVSSKDILESRGRRGSQQIKFSPGLEGTIPQSSERAGSQMSYFSFFVSENYKPKSYVNGNTGEMDDRCIDSKFSQSISESSSFPTSKCAIDDTLSNSERSSVVSSGISVDQQAESNPINMSMEDGDFSDLQKVITAEASFNELCDKELSYPDCSRIGPPEFEEYLKGTNQRSPDSVLEPFDNQNPSIFGSFESMGLLLRLQDLDFDFEATNSEGSAMVVSGDEDSLEPFGDLSCSGRKIEGWFGDEESRNYSYMVDVLNEAGFCSVKSLMDLNSWDFSECPISLSVFDSLEKKYGKQKSWLKCERRLLFDRISSGLMATVNPIIHASPASVRRWLNAALRRDRVEDELWTILMNEEKEKSRNLSEKALGERMKWPELEEDYSIICRELEGFLFDELVMELASLCD